MTRTAAGIRQQELRTGRTGCRKGSAFLCGMAGIEETTLANSAAYLDGWRKVIKEDTRLWSWPQPPRRRPWTSSPTRTRRRKRSGLIIPAAVPGLKTRLTKWPAVRGTAGRIFGQGHLVGFPGRFPLNRTITTSPRLAPAVDLAGTCP